MRLRFNINKFSMQNRFFSIEASDYSQARLWFVEYCTCARPGFRPPAVLKLLCLPLAEVPDYSLRVSYMKDLVRSLPLPNHNTMELLFKHMRR